MVLKSGNFLHTRTYVSACCHEMVLIYGEFVIYPYVCLHTTMKGERKKEGRRGSKETNSLTDKETNKLLAKGLLFNIHVSFVVQVHHPPPPPPTPTSKHELVCCKEL